MFCYRKIIGHRTQPNRTPNANRSDSERNPIGLRTQPDRTPNAIRLDSERNPIRFRTRTDAYCIAIHSLKSFFRLSLLNLILTEHKLTIDYGIDRKHYANADKNAQKHNKYAQRTCDGVEHAEENVGNNEQSDVYGKLQAERLKLIAHHQTVALGEAQRPIHLLAHKQIDSEQPTEREYNSRY